MKLFYSIFILFSMTFWSVFGAEAVIPEQTGVMVEGTLRTQGLPGFSANRIDALFARYESLDLPACSVWGTGEPLVFDPAIWQNRTIGGLSHYFATTPDGRQIWIIRRTFAMKRELSEQSRWYFAFSFDSVASNELCAAFIETLIKRTEFFFISAKRPEDLSFPALVTVAGNQKKAR